MSTKKTDQPELSSITPDDKKSDTRPVCGLIMPIADTEGYKIGHWEEIKMLISSVAEDAGFRTRLVSDSDDVRIIQSTIVQNVYGDDIVICDVSSKNPNVMFELGLRLAFDKAAVIIKDDVTTYSFDTSPIAHIGYRKDLHYYSTEEFKKELKSKLKYTYEKSKSSDNSMYLGSFGKFEIQNIKTTTVTNDEFILENLKEIRKEINNLKINRSDNPASSLLSSYPSMTLNTYRIMMNLFKEHTKNVKEGDKDSEWKFIKMVAASPEFNNDTRPKIPDIVHFYENQGAFVPRINF